MSLIPFPNVPNVPGVPNLPRLAVGAAVATTGLGLLQGFIYRAFQVQTRWGIYDKAGKALADPAKITGLLGAAIETIGLGSTLSTNAVEYSKDMRISDFPVEKGGFASYNKVESPACPVVTLCMGGSEANRKEFLEKIDKACKSTDLYSVVTPEITYTNYSIEKYNYQRTSTQGATLLKVEITLKEIRQVSAQYSQAAASPISDPKDPGATPDVDSGKVQAQTPKVSTLKSIVNKIPGLAGKAGNLLKGGL